MATVFAGAVAAHVPDASAQVPWESEATQHDPEAQVPALATVLAGAVAAHVPLASAQVPLILMEATLAIRQATANFM